MQKGREKLQTVNQGRERGRKTPREGKTGRLEKQKGTDTDRQDRYNICCCNSSVHLACWIRRRGWGSWWMARWKWWCSCQRCSGRAAWPQGCGAEACSSRWPDHLYPGHPSDGLRSAEWEERDRTDKTDVELASLISVFPKVPVHCSSRLENCAARSLNPLEATKIISEQMNRVAEIKIYLDSRIRLREVIAFR